MSTKRIIFLILILALGAQIIFFAWWMLNDPSFKTLLFSEQGKLRIGEKDPNKIETHSDDKRVFNERIQEVNTEVGSTIGNVPDALAQELRESRLYFMFSNKGGFGTRSFVFDNNEFFPSALEGARDLFYTYSQGQTKLAYLVDPDPDSIKNDPQLQKVQVYLADAAETKTWPFPQHQSSTKISDSDLPVKQHLSVSDEGAVLLNADIQGHGEHGVARAEDASIYLIKDGKTEFLMNGFVPQWINEQEFVFLKNDGLYKATLGQPEVKLIMPAQAGIEIGINNRLDVSNDGMYITWMQPQHSQMAVLILNVATQEYVPYFTVSDVKGFWSEISPSSKYIAVQTINPNLTGEEASTNAKIEFYDMETQKKVPNFEISLDKFYQLSMFMTEWVKK